MAVYTTYQSSGSWFVMGGTSASAPIIAGIAALAENPKGINGPSLYTHSQALHDITDGSNGTCIVDYLCKARPGYDGPTGLGTPDGIDAFLAGQQ